MQRRLRLRRDTAAGPGPRPADATADSGPRDGVSDLALPLVLPPPDPWEMHLVLSKNVWRRPGRIDGDSPQASALRLWPQRRDGR